MELVFWIVVKGKLILKKIKEGLEVGEKFLVFVKWFKVV